MSYTDFYIRYEHEFLRNIYSKEELEMPKELKSLGSCYEVFDRFLTIVILLESVITNWGTFSETSKEKLSNFMKNIAQGLKITMKLLDKLKKLKLNISTQKFPIFLNNIMLLFMVA